VRRKGEGGEGRFRAGVGTSELSQVTRRVFVPWVVGAVDGPMCFSNQFAVDIAYWVPEMA